MEFCKTLRKSAKDILVYCCPGKYTTNFASDFSVRSNDDDFSVSLFVKTHNNGAGHIIDQCGGMRKIMSDECTLNFVGVLHQQSKRHR
jgi:hypothetical protein